MTGDDALGKVRDEIVDYLRAQSFTIFRGREVENGGLGFSWKDTEDWKGFLDVARQEQVRIIVYDERTFDKEEYEGWLASLSEEVCDWRKEPAEIEIGRRKARCNQSVLG